MFVITLETPSGILETVTAPDREAACSAASNLVLRCHELHHGDLIRVIERDDRQMTKETNEKSVLKVNRYGDDAFYAKWDEDTGAYCVFGNQSGRFYDSFASIEHADARVWAMTEALRRL